VSLAIDIDRVSSVLLADGWHLVKDFSFYLDAYEYLWYPDRGDDPDPITTHGGGSSGICATGFGFHDRDADAWVYGPLTSILAVKQVDL
jgi:hypothetical protein